MDIIGEFELTARSFKILFKTPLNFRYLELQSSGRRNEIRFHFAYVTSDNELMVHTESFSFHLADNNWHKIALVVSGTQLQLIIDCNVIYTRVTSFVPDRNFSASSMQLLIGQRNLNGHSLFKVSRWRTPSECFNPNFFDFYRAIFKRYTWCLEPMDI